MSNSIWSADAAGKADGRGEMMHRRGMLAIVMLLAGWAAAVQAGPGTPDVVAYRVPAKLRDVMEALPPDQVQLRGYLGERVARNEKNRLLQVDEAPLLAGFRHKPGEQAWIGEHVGKWLHAATLAWVNTGDPALRTKLDRVAAELIKTQEPDGYLGTYTPDKRFGLYPNADWDVWVHKYDLIGLLTYYHYTGNQAALDACRKVGDLLINTFGPGKKSILAAGTHVGMAATSVLEPTVLLYRTTGDARYLEFAKYLVSAWDEPRGPRVMTTLLTEKSVEKTGNGKAYEMLSNLVGLCELARATGDRQYLQTAVNAWEDVTAHQLYITGSASSHEHFHAPYELPNQQGANVGETCVTVTWIQLNAQLLRLTGEARYGDELERSYYNHLAAAQRPDGAQWCYYTSLEGIKPYGPGINCCVSSGPRGMALAPQLTYLKLQDGGKDALAVNLFESSTVTTELGGRKVSLEQSSDFPPGTISGPRFQGTSTLTVRTERPAEFGLRVRSPEWADGLALRVNDRKETIPGPKGGWAVLPARRWKNGDRVTVSYRILARVVMGDHGNAGRAALKYGPLVLAYDDKRNPELPSARALTLGIGEMGVKALPGDTVQFEIPVVLPDGKARKAVFVPFAEAGSTGGRYQVWLRAPGSPPLPASDSLFSYGDESRSREGNQNGSINDGDPGTFVVTFDQQRRGEDWFAVRQSRPVTLRRVVYAHGHSFHDGGWFDASAGKPRIQVQREKDGPWETVGTLEEYPDTTATDPKGLKDGQAFTLRLTEPVQAVAIRVIGKPACGDNPQQAFSSCGELQGFGS
ncbi:MAG TPA: beta-L-arabinofuranosidase domain-containing protein [Armatimonadota bacterium]|nr:beta-L-arabinofuranosidase domain-containing protein [Armatimonadota bacterium]